MFLYKSILILPGKKKPTGDKKKVGKVPGARDPPKPVKSKKAAVPSKKSTENLSRQHLEERKRRLLKQRNL